MDQQEFFKKYEQEMKIALKSAREAKENLGAVKAVLREQLQVVSELARAAANRRPKKEDFISLSYIRYKKTALAEQKTLLEEVKYLHILVERLPKELRPGKTKTKKAPTRPHELADHCRYLLRHAINRVFYSISLAEDIFRSAEVFYRKLTSGEFPRRNEGAMDKIHREHDDRLLFARAILNLSDELADLGQGQSAKVSPIVRKTVYQKPA